MSGYTIGEIIVWLLLAALLGGLLGWFLRQLKCQREHGEARQSATAAPAKAEAVTPPPAKAAALSGAGTVESAGFARSAKPLAGGKAPSPEYTIKGNADSMYFHTPDSPSYGRTIAEVWFKTEADARAAGFTAPGTGGGTKKAPAKKAPAKAAAKKAPAKTAAKKAPAKKAPAKKAVAPGRFPGSAKPLSGGRAPSAEYTIKGNEDSMIYHAPDSPSYGRTIAETWFKTEAAAVAAGFRKPRNA
ncbi:hypothetical protein GCM10022234_26400 [Aeromicrobium panaciterrae]|uniref:sunset domain-containing protein n=1 Tax=Aeromicrobium panaciterrae TaxID=363861 RepID=UPI0031CEEC26